MSDSFNVRRFLIAAGAGLVLLAVVQGVAPLLGIGGNAPFPASGKHVLIVTQNTSEAGYPKWLDGTPFREALDARGKWRIWDADFSGDDLKNADKTFAAAFNKAKSDERFEPPWLIWSDGRKGWSGPLPKTEADTLHKIGGGK